MCVNAPWLATVNQWFQTPVVKALGTFLIAYVIYRLGLRAYFLQKSSEYGRERYLKSGADQVAAQVDYALGVYRHNWALLLRFTKLCRESPVPLDASDFVVQFRELDQSYFQIAPAHRLSSLLGDDAVWSGYQKVFSFVGTRNDFIKADFGLALPEHLGNPHHPKKAGFISATEQQAFEMDKEAKPLYVFLSLLLDLTALIETAGMRPKDIKKFRLRKDVTAIAGEMTRVLGLQTKESAVKVPPAPIAGEDERSKCVR